MVTFNFYRVLIIMWMNWSQRWYMYDAYLLICVVMTLSLTLKIIIFIPDQIKITSQPAETLELTEGDLLRLEVEGVGFPYPRYQWFRLNPSTSKYQEVHGQNLKVLKIDKCRYIYIKYILSCIEIHFTLRIQKQFKDTCTVC